MIGELLKNLGSFIAAGGGGAAIAWVIFKKLGDGWLADRFAKRLETFKYEQVKDLEQLRHKITSLFSRISKIHEKEFEVLPMAWLKLHQAYGLVSRLCSALKQFPDFRQMSTPMFEAFVAGSALHEVRKKELLALEVSERDQYYREGIFWSELAEAKSAQMELNNYLVMNRIFMNESLCKSFNEINALLKSIIITQEIVNQMPHLPAVELRQQLEIDLAKIEPLLPPLESAIQERLHYSEA